MHSEPFGSLTKLGAKRAELVQKFMPRSRVGIFRNEGTRSTPCDPKLTFWCIRTIWVHSGLFGCLTKLGAKNRPNLCKSSCHEVASEFFATNTPDPPHWTLNLRFGAFATIWVHSGPFGCLYETRCKTGRTSAKVRATKLRRSFSQRTHPIHPVGP